MFDMYIKKIQPQPDNRFSAPWMSVKKKKIQVFLIHVIQPKYACDWYMRTGWSAGKDPLS